MLLRTSLTSPFGRKIRIASLRLGMSDRIQVVSADTTDPADEIRKDNPLGKAPLLILDNGQRVYDSRVILEYLDHMAGGGVLIPLDWTDKLETLVFQSLGDSCPTKSATGRRKSAPPNGLNTRPARFGAASTTSPASILTRPAWTSPPSRSGACSAILTGANRLTGAASFPGLSLGLTRLMLLRPSSPPRPATPAPLDCSRPCD